MADLLTADHKQGMVSSFLEIAVGHTADTVRQFLLATGWKFDEAIQLFYVDNEGSTLERQSDHSDTVDGSSVHAANDSASVVDGQPANMGPSHIDDVPPPLPVKRDVLYDDPLFYASSGMSNPKTSVVAMMIGNQVSDDTIEGGKMRTFYKLDSFPVVLFIDPITGQKMQSQCGMIQPESLLEPLWSFCHSHLGDAEKRPFRLAPEASKSLDYETNMTFGEAGIANSMISVSWE